MSVTNAAGAETAAYGQPSAAEKLITLGREAWAALARLDSREVAVNLALSAVVVLAALGLIALLRRLFDRWLARFATDMEAFLQRVIAWDGRSWNG